MIWLPVIKGHCGCAVENTTVGGCGGARAEAGRWVRRLCSQQGRVTVAGPRAQAVQGGPGSGVLGLL